MLVLVRNLIFLSIGLWAVFSIIYILKLRKTTDVKKFNLYIYESIPSVFTTLGILGTFIGIFIGLMGFDVNQISESIPILLNGLKTAFSTSIAGIILSLIFGKITEYNLKKAENTVATNQVSELTALNKIIDILTETKLESKEDFKKLNSAIIGEKDDSISTQLIKLRNQFTDITGGQEKNIEILTKVQNSLGGDKETSLLTQTSKLRADQNDYYKNSNKNNLLIIENLQKVHKSLGIDEETNILTQFKTLREEQINFNKDLDDKNKSMNENLEGIKNFLGNEDTGLLSQVKDQRADQKKYSDEAKKNIDLIIKSMNDNYELISKNFKEFSELLAKNNTETLVEVMKKSTEQFNKQMKELINKLVQENFKELNNSVQQLNSWQKENKEMIEILTNQFKQVSNEFKVSSVAINEITENTTKLTNDNSHLTKLITELQKVMIDDTKYQDIVGKLIGTIDTLKTNTDAFDETTNKLNNWVKNQMNFNDSVAKLLTRLEEIDKIKDINQVFWKNTKKQLNEGVSAVEKASKKISIDVKNINAEFYERLNNTLQNLDTLIQRIIENYRK